MPDRTRILAIDYGARRIGLALSDELRIIASGLPTIEHSPRLLDDIAQLILRHEVSLIVVGLPLTLRGEVGATAASVIAFVEALRLRCDVPVETFDERFTSSLAEDAMRRGGMKRSRRAEKGKVDEIAAVILLQDYLQSRAITRF
jgi:putative holliday junction resolvase